VLPLFYYCYHGAVLCSCRGWQERR
jgi:hypothetical protein